MNNDYSTFQWLIKVDGCALRFILLLLFPLPYPRTSLKCYLNILLLIAFFCLVFHVSLNSRNTKLKNDGVHWGSLDIYAILHISFKAMYFVF